MIQVGKAAPEFTAEGIFGDEIKKVSLSDYRGRWLVLVFYPLDFTFVCPTEVTAFDMDHNKFEEMNTEVLTISVDSVYSHKAWKKEIGLINLGMLSDMTKEISRKYGVLIEEEGISQRGTFVIDPDGILKMTIIHDLNVGRNVDEIIRVVQACQTGELCPVGWKPGQQTLGKA